MPEMEHRLILARRKSALAGIVSIRVRKASTPGFETQKAGRNARPWPWEVPENRLAYCTSMLCCGRQRVMRFSTSVITYSAPSVTTITRMIAA